MASVQVALFFANFDAAMENIRPYHETSVNIKYIKHFKCLSR